MGYIELRVVENIYRKLTRRWIGWLWSRAVEAGLVPRTITEVHLEATARYLALQRLLVRNTYYNFKQPWYTRHAVKCNQYS